MKPFVEKPELRQYTWTYRILRSDLYGQDVCCVTYGPYELNLLTGEDPDCACGALPSEELVVSLQTAKEIVRLLNNNLWEPS